MHVSARAHAVHYQARPLQPTNERRTPEDTDTGRVREVRRRPEEDRRKENSRQRPAARQPDQADDPFQAEDSSSVAAPSAPQGLVAPWSPIANAQTAALWTLLGTVQADAPLPASAGSVIDTPRIDTPPAAGDASLQDLLALVSKV